MIEFKYRHVHISCFLSIYTYLVPISVIHIISSYAPVINPSVFSKVPAETEWYPATVGSENWHIGIPIKPYRDYNKPWHYRIPITSTKKMESWQFCWCPALGWLYKWPPNSKVGIVTSQLTWGWSLATNWITWLRDLSPEKNSEVEIEVFLSSRIIFQQRAIC